MKKTKKLAIAALLHDLPKLVEKTGVTVSNDAQQVLDLAHLADPVLDAIIEQAEQYASAGENLDHLVIDEPLISIFSRISLTHSPGLQYHRVEPLPATTEKHFARLFPDLERKTSGVKQQVQKLLKALSWLGQSVDLTQDDHVYHHLLALINRYSWCLPGHSQDTTLFDHVRLTSAAAVALGHYFDQYDDLTVEMVKAKAKEQCFCLLVGDLSGIQKYIFDITTIGAGGGVARRLRARSFYLAVLADVLSHRIAGWFDMPEGNVIMASGGKFYVLLPNNDNIETEIAELRKEIDLWFQDQFNSEITINLAHICFSGDLFQAGSQDHPGFGHVLTELSSQLNHEKRRTGQSILSDGKIWNEAAFVINRDFWGVGVCVSCRKFPAEPERENLCAQCIRDAELGKRLPRARYVAYYPDQTGNLPMPLGCSARVLTGERDLEEAGQPYLLTKLNDPDIADLAGYAGSFRYLANHIPLNHYGAPLTFDCIANEAAGRPLLGYLKADVDYLGILFAQGLRRNEGGYDTATHIAALSRELDLFFSGWVQHLLDQNATYQKFYTVFSGGDDLFLLGPWDKVGQLAMEINKQFAAFVGENRDITLSAGILFTKERYPISRAADDAEQVLELSKEERNRLTILGNTFAWAEAPQIFKQIDELKNSSDQLTSAFLYDLVEYSRLYRLWAEEEKVEGLRYKAMFAYNIARNLRRKDEKLYRWADRLMQSLASGKTQQRQTMQHLGLIATYLLFSRRERS